MGQQEATVDTSALEALGVTGGEAKQTMYSALEVNESIDKPDDLSFYFNVDLPKDILQDGTIIYQWAQITPTADSSADKVSIACKVQVGNPRGTEVAEFSGTTSMETSTQTGKKYSEVNTGDLVSGSSIKKNDDDDFYALGDSDFGFKNKVQSCLAQLEIEKMVDNSSLFQEYDVKLGARVYADKDDTNPISLTESSTTMTIQAPTYEAKEFDPDEDFPEDLEYEYFELADREKEATVTLPNGDTTDITQYLYVEMEANKDYTRPDVLSFDFGIDGKEEVLEQGQVVF